ncbi:uncharacterized protein [Parasteatoda tepidariorum]|uniref:uncharacterized protein n=1 Tax=Parasteatoda tepidariorum TaxID=114398 RepID=UPI001C723716|nr:uncharacterized protein LOC107446829 [Parasteatoda tepidariorum]
MMHMRSCSGFTDLKSGSIIVCHYAMGLSFMALILLTCRLHEVDREVGYLQAVINDWFPHPDTTTPAQQATPANRYLNLLQEELIQFYLPELRSSRTTLVLSVVFVGIYIGSWWWMAFAIKQVSRGGSVSLRTVLLLAVFAAVDIAASTGFVLLRLIMYIRRDRFYPQGLRPLSPQMEADQMAAYTSLRLITIKSSCGNADILVSVVVGFLTVLRIYSVVCVASFYKKAKSGSRDIFQKDITGSCDTSERTESVKDFEDYNPKSLIIDYAKNKPHYTSHRDRRSSIVAASTLPPPQEDDLMDLKVQASDMALDMQRAAVHAASQAIRIYSTEKHIAESIKQDFDQLYHPTWHCIVGRNWGSCVTHSKQCYVRMSYKDMTIMLYRST